MEGSLNEAETGRKSAAGRSCGQVELWTVKLNRFIRFTSDFGLRHLRSAASIEGGRADGNGSFE